MTLQHTSSHGRYSRRDWLTIGGLGALGLMSSDLELLRSLPAATPAAEKKRRNSCVFLFLFGGPSQIDLWDMKPQAPEQVRGIFRPVATQTPGINICEHLPKIAGITNDLCLLRSMTHRMNVHGPACSEVFSGRPYFGPPVTDQATREDWPSLSSLVTRYGDSRGGLPPSVVLPWHLQFPGQSKRIAGQTGGRMGEQFDPFLLDGDVGKGELKIEGLRLPADVPLPRLKQRRELVHRMDARQSLIKAPISFDANSRNVYELLENRVSDVFDLSHEREAIRERYGSTAIGQSLLLARRLVEANVSLINVNWQDETITDGVNTCWDTHQNNFNKLQNLLCPLFDQAFSAFISDLRERGLLETTLVVALGEFGRTPKMGQFTQSSNTQKTGRDHWPHAFTALLAGGGVRGGQIYGATTRDAGYVADKPVTPADLTATILHHLGIDFRKEYVDEFQQRKNRLSEGVAVTDLG